VKCQTCNTISKAKKGTVEAMVDENIVYGAPQIGRKMGRRGGATDKIVLHKEHARPNLEELLGSVVQFQPLTDVHRAWPQAMAKHDSTMVSRVCH